MTRKIVIIDDEPHIRSLIEQTLEDLEDEYDIELFTAVNGREGLELIRQERPELVFLDVMMPLMNGYEVTREVRRDADLNGVYIVLLTAKGQEIDRSTGLDAGAGRYVTKPFDPDELLLIARQSLGLE